MTKEEKNYMKAILEESCAYNGLRIFEELDKENNALKLKLNKQKEINKEYVDEVEKLKKNALEWHKVTCFDKPDENGWITNDCPSYDNREYLVRTKRGHYAIQELMEIDNGVTFEDYEWEEVDAWAELPEGNVNG